MVELSLSRRELRSKHFHELFQRVNRASFRVLLDKQRFKQMLNMISLEADNSHVVLDLGCGKGFLSHILCREFDTVGLDIRRIFSGSNVSEKPNFVLGDLSFLPFRTDIIDIVVCGSVLEHIKVLDYAIKEARRVLKQNGVLIAGYPVETRVFKFFLKLFSPRDFKFIDQTQSDFVNPYSQKKEDYWTHPSTHKQTYKSIRQALRRHFRVMKRDKLPFKFLPDLLSFYECLKICKLKQNVMSHGS